jgi:predicted small metal-binding protein
MVGCSAVVFGCSSPVSNAKDKYEIVKRTGDKREICRKSRELAEALLAAKEEEEYRIQKLQSQIDCAAADLEI